MNTTTKILRILMVIVGFSALLALIQCDKKSISEPDRVTSLLKANTWKISTVMVDGTDQTTMFKNLALSFTDKGFTATNGGLVWPANGTWSFVDSNAKAITRDDGIVVTLDSATDSAITLSLSWTKTTLSGGRESSIAGKYVFVLLK